MDIPENALLNQPLTSAVIGADGIWDDFCYPIPPIDLKTSSNLCYSSSNLSYSPCFYPEMSERLADRCLDEAQFHIECSDPKIPIRNRNILTSEDAKNIYIFFLTGCNERPGASVVVSQQFGISPKTVRDIWNR